MISCGSWNIRGINNPLKQEEVSRFLLDNKVAICGLLETRTREDRAQSIVSKMCRNWEWTSNHLFSELGRIWVVWDPRALSFDVTAMTEQAIHGRAVLGNGAVVHLSFVYGLCDYRNRRDLWKDLIFNYKTIRRAPWLILGDFNVSRYPHDQLNGPSRVTKAMTDFNACLNSIEVDDIKSVGRFFNWTNKRDGRFDVNKKLDRALGNWGWNRGYNHSSAHFHNPGVSDHSPIYVAMNAPWRPCNKPFKFINFWVKEERFMGIVNRIWGQKIYGNPLEVVLSKLRNLKRELKLAFKQPNPKPRKEAIRSQLETLQDRLLLQPTDSELIRQEKALLLKLNKVKSEEESFFRQKSSITWLKLGDSNNKFFHRSVAALHHKSHIGKLQRLDGSWA
ncbi:Exo_endo_phos domain-containing protein [Cephalotus follicularis]|uniref:Exo_endo_phos domain-containing protein n=1 Tax=Cephalotus follicularis TaxID=3775 RepID=A0A1Q3DJS5_CEPFO|nr:Exo_endo_phos domain-containing protein [Cephalotus follicularis]